MDPTPLTLPPLPRGVRLLTNAESQALDARSKMTGFSVANCITCRGRKTFLWKAPDGTPATYACPCADQYLTFRYLLNAGVPLSYQRLGWADYEHLSGAVVERLGSFFTNRQRYLDAGFGMVLHGSRGNGKTLLANLILKELLADGISCYSTTFADMISNFMDSWRDKEQRRWFSQTVRNAAVLYIDDVGREYQTGSDRYLSQQDRKEQRAAHHDTRPGAVRETMLEEVIRYRVGNCLPTFVSTNFSPEDVESGYGGHTMSLLSEKAIFVEVTGADRRPEIREREEQYLLAGMTRPIVIDHLIGGTA